MTATSNCPPSQARLRRLTLRPSSVRAGDWVRDLGRLRQVRSIEALDDGAAASTLYAIRFADDTADGYPTLGVRESIPLTLWREP